MKTNQLCCHWLFTRNKKGFALSLDAFLAITIFIVLVITANAIFSEEFSPAIEKTSTLKMANDLMDLLDYEDKLENADAQLLEEEINLALPERLDWKMEIETYTYNGVDFDLVSTQLLGDLSEDLTDKDLIKTRRLFLTFEDNQIKNYNNAEFTVWSK